MRRAAVGLLTLALLLSACTEGRHATNRHQAATLPATVVTPAPTSGARTVQPGAKTVDLIASIHSRTTARQRAEIVLNRVVLPAGAVRVASPPAASLADGQPVAQKDLPTQVTTRWWQVPEAPATLRQFLSTHPPVGMESIGRAGEAMEFDPVGADGCSCFPYTETVLALTVAADGDQAAVRADALVIWRPGRSAQETIPEALRTVQLAVSTAPPEGDQPGVVGKAGTVHTAAVRSLVARLNQLPVDTSQGSAGCGAFGPRVSMTFRYSGHRLHLGWWYFDCGRVAVTFDDRVQPTLSAGPDVLVLVEHLLRVKTTTVFDPRRHSPTPTKR